MMQWWSTGDSQWNLIPENSVTAAIKDKLSLLVKSKSKPIILFSLPWEIDKIYLFLSTLDFSEKTQFNFTPFQQKLECILHLNSQDLP